MKGKEILRGAALAGGLLGLFGSSIDMATNPSIQNLEKEEQLINPNNARYVTGTRVEGTWVVDGDYSNEQKEEIINQYIEDYEELLSVPENKEANERRKVDTDIWFGSLLDLAGLSMWEVYKRELEGK